LKGLYLNTRPGKRSKKQPFVSEDRVVMAAQVNLAPRSLGPVLRGQFVNGQSKSQPTCRTCEGGTKRKKNARFDRDTWEGFEMLSNNREKKGGCQPNISLVEVRLSKQVLSKTKGGGGAPGGHCNVVQRRSKKREKRAGG